MGENLHHWPSVATIVDLLLIKMHKVPMPGQELSEVVNWKGQSVFLQMRDVLGSEYILSKLS